MGKDKKKKGKLRRSFKKVFCCFFPWTASRSQTSPEDDFHEPSPSEIQTHPSSEASESSATENPQKFRKSFLASLKGKMKSHSIKTDSTVPAQPRNTAALGGAAMLVSESSDSSDEAFLPDAQRNLVILKEHTGIQMVQTLTLISIDSLCLSENSEDDFYDVLDDEPRDFDDKESPTTSSMDCSFSFSFSFSWSVSSNDTSFDIPITHLDEDPVIEHYPMETVLCLDVLPPISFKNEWLTQKETRQLIQCSSEPPKQKDENDNERQNILNVKPICKYMGFPNLGNTCYMNATLQCLLSLPPIVEDIIFQEKEWEKIPGSKLLRAINDLHFTRMNKTNNKQKSQLLAAIKNCIAMRNPDFQGDDEQDANEFLLILLAQMKDEAQMCQQTKNTFRSPVAHLEFKINHVRTCQTCGNQVCSLEELNCLPLAIGPQKSLTESLQQYFTASSLEFRCSKCPGTKATETAEIQTLPKVLVLMVTRLNMLSAKKIKGRLAVPEELSLSSFTGPDRCEQTEYTNQQPADTTYKLNGVVSHHGSSLYCGHYKGNTRDLSGAEWLSCDDDDVKSVSWSNASKTIENHGYMLFYLRSEKKRLKNQLQNSR